MKIEPFGEMKLVIWDLDETFWRGVISEGWATWRIENERLVKDLAARGVIASICSHNDEKPVLEALTRHDIREYFVFPRISWKPKGPQIAGIIQEAQLRAENVLFIDDQPRNLAEAKAACPHIKVAGPDDIRFLFQAVEASTANDSALKRLGQYQVLERKNRDQATVISQGKSRQAFLRETCITIHHVTDVVPHAERIHTIINRTNQLNFTKCRHEKKDETLELLQRPDWRKGCFQVSDRYGNYGLVAFYAGPKDGPLQHFLFSCRVMNMGIVEYVYDFLSRPEIETKEDIETLTRSNRPQWIQAGQDDGPSHPKFHGTKKASAPRILARGGCLLDFLETPLSQLLGAQMDLDLSQWGSHSSALRLIDNPGVYTHEELNAFSKRVANTPVFPSTMIFEKPYDLFIFEFSKDYRCSLYQADTDVYLPIAPVGVDLSKPEHWEKVAAWRKNYRKVSAPGPWFSRIYDPMGLAFLRDEARYVPGEERREIFATNMTWTVETLLSKNPEATILFLLNSEAEPEDMLECWRHVPAEVGFLNPILASIAKRHASVEVLSLSAYVSTPKAFTTPSPFLLRWDIVRQIATEVAQIYQKGH